MRGGKENHRKNTLETEGHTTVLVQDEVMTGRFLCLEIAKEFILDGSLSSVK